MDKELMKQKLTGALNQIIAGLEVLKQLTLEMATSDELPEGDGLELLKAVKQYRTYQQQFEAIRDRVES